MRKGQPIHYITIAAFYTLSLLSPFAVQYQAAMEVPNEAVIEASCMEHHSSDTRNASKRNDFRCGLCVIVASHLADAPFTGGIVKIAKMQSATPHQEWFFYHLLRQNGRYYQAISRAPPLSHVS